MLKKKILRRILLIISFILLITSTVNTTFGFVVAKTDTLVNYFVPVEKLVNSLIISKTVEHPLGEGYVIPENISFDFKVDLGEYYAETTLKTSIGELKTDKNGSVVLSVKPNRQVTVEGLETETKVTVTEINNNTPGFSVKNGESKKEIIISDGAQMKADFINLYTPSAVAPTNVTLTGSKTLSGRPWQEGDEFTFLLEQNMSGVWTELGKETVSYKEGESDFNKFDFTEYLQKLSFSKTGEYQFRVSEVKGNLQNVDYDQTVNTFVIKVTDRDMDGKLEIGNVESSQNAATVTTDNGFAIDVAFNNTFIPPLVPDDVSVRISVNKTVENKGEYKRSAEGFEFILEDKFGDKASFKSDENGLGAEYITVSESDIGEVLEYKVYEKNTGEKGVTYDTKVYTLRVAVSLNEDNTLKTDITVDGENVTEVSLDFKNVCDLDKPSGPATGDNRIIWWMLLAAFSFISCVTLIIAEHKYRGVNGDVTK